MSQPIVVTGAAGFIGSHVSEALLRSGRAVVGIDCFDPFYARETKERNAALISKTASETGSSFELHELDLCDQSAITGMFESLRPEGVIHLAAKAGVRPSIADPVGYATANLVGTASVLEACERAGCDRAVVASSSSVYGNNKKTPFSEEDPVELPISPYASTKRGCELLCATHQHLTGRPVACLRFFTVFGPRQRPDLAISLFMRKVALGEAIPVFGDGSMQRDFTYIDDIVAGVLASYERIGGHGFRVWNLGHDHPVRLDEMIATVGRVVGIDPIIDRRPVPPGDVDRTWADLSRSRNELGYDPKTAFEDGVRAQWVWMKPLLQPA
ncbi:MAG: GDP-mannose 4,6-dehydratase [Planctomycetota bacterium]